MRDYHYYCMFLLTFRDIGFCIKRRVKLSSDIDRIFNAWCTSTLIGAIRDQHADNTCTECFGMNIVQQFCFVRVHSRIFSALVASAVVVYLLVS